MKTITEPATDIISRLIAHDDAREVSDAQDEFVNERQEEADELESEIEEMKEDTETYSAVEVSDKEAEHQALRADITKAQRYTF